jgi:phosphotransferase system HPr (HPr) family protein
MSGSSSQAGRERARSLTGDTKAEMNRATLLQTGPNAMSGETLQRQVTITNPLGFHLRPMAAFAKLAGQFDSTVMVMKGQQRVNGKSTLELMLLAAEQGAELVVEVTGSDARAALDALVAVLAAPSMDDVLEEGSPSPTG